MSLIESVLKIEYNIKEGLCLNWNFVPIRPSAVYFRHLFVIFSANVELVGNLLEKIYEKIQPGHFMGCVYLQTGRLLPQIFWKEKTLLKKAFPRLERFQTKETRVQEILAYALTQVALCVDPVIINIIVENQQQCTRVTEQIKLHRTHAGQSFAVSFFGPFSANHHQTVTGLSKFVLEANSLQRIIPFYFGFLSSFEYTYARLEVESTKGELVSCSQENWKNTEFNRIEREYYQPSSRYTKDTLSLINQNSKEDTDFGLKVTLHLHSICNSHTRFEKKLTVRVHHDKQYMETCIPDEPPPLCEPIKHFLLDHNPYQSKSTIKFCMDKS